MSKQKTPKAVRISQKLDLSGVQQLAEAYARNAKGGEVFALYGSLGSGKTTFVKAFAHALGVTRVTSPTFVLMNVYELPYQEGVAHSRNADTHQLKRLCHVDAYRVQHSRELSNVGFPEYLSDSQCVCILEWADRVQDLLPNNRVSIHFQILSQHLRGVTVNRT